MAKLPSNKTIKDLAELLGETGLTEIEIETGDMRIKVARQGTAVSAV
ncbi:MAG TPA: acetyl-CoA carboxylase biotin carboxyl carrier protein, partial [Rhodobiaceae bacterium]|nr:acetyl-CoA carboxylase biotin carboxyl carrier protein [Rhodobiaceae bacterium]